MTTDPSTKTLLVADRRHPGHLAIASSRPWYRPVARLLGSSLDRQLAAGRAPESGRLLAWRALWLTSSQGRCELTRGWEMVRERAGRQPYGRDPRVAVCQDRVRSAEIEIGQLLRALTDPLPVAVRGVAMASWLLCDGAGPLYNPRSPSELDAALRRAIIELDPWTELRYSDC